MNKLWMMTTMAALVLLGGCGSKDEPSAAAGENKPAAKAAAPVLPRIETFEPPGSGEKQTYDHIKESLDLAAASVAAGQEPPAFTQSAKPLPPTLVDTLAADTRMVAFTALGLGKLDAATVTVDQMNQILELYVKIDGMHLAGLRPRTHQKFIVSLTADERKQLAGELVEHIRKNGFKGDDAIGDEPARPRSEAAIAALGGGAAAATATATTPGAPAPAGVPIYAGTYKSTFGRMVLEQAAADPTTVTGRYSKGTVACTATGESLACKWDEGGSSKGAAKFTRHHNGDLTGRWGLGKNASSGGKWTANLVKRDAMH